MHWQPPFPARQLELQCPSCGVQGHVWARVSASYCDGDTVDAYCGHCHQPLEVTARVRVAFVDAACCETGSVEPAADERGMDMLQHDPRHHG